MVKLVAPVDSAVPPVEAAYQSIVDPEAAVALMVTVPDPQTEPPVAPVGADGIVFTVAVTALLVDETQPVVVFLASA